MAKTCYSCGRELVRYEGHGISFDGCHDCPTHPDAIVQVVFPGPARRIAARVKVEELLRSEGITVREGDER